MLNKGRLYAAALLLTLALSIVSMPLVLLQKIQVGGGSFSISYVFVAAGIAVAALYRLRHLGRSMDFKVERTSAQLAGLFLLIAGASLVNGANQKFLISMTFWMIAILVGRSIPVVGQWRLTTGMEWLAVALALVGIGLYHLNLPLFDFEEMASDMYFMNDNGFYRASSVFLNPNSFAYFLVFYLCLAARRPRPHGWGTLIGCAIAVVAMWLSDSRSATLSCTVIVLALCLRRIRPVYARLVYHAFNGTLLTLFAVLLMFAGSLYAFDIRFEKWHMALGMWSSQLEYWLLGIPNAVPIERNGITFSDNMFLELLFRLGLFGFLYFLCFYLVMLGRSVAILCGDSIEAKAAAPYALFILASSIPMFYSNYFYFYPVVVLHGLAAGIVLRTRAARAMNKVSI